MGQRELFLNILYQKKHETNSNYLNNESECAFVHTREAREPYLSSALGLYGINEVISLIYLFFYEFVYLSTYTGISLHVHLSYQ